MRRFFIALVLAAVSGMASGADVIYSDIVGDVFTMRHDTVISENVLVDVGDIRVASMVYLENRGQIYGDISVCAECMLVMQNSGEFIGVINADRGSQVTQLISSDADVGEIEVHGAYNVLVRDAVGIDFDELRFVARSAEHLVLRDTEVFIGNAIMPLRQMPDIVLQGTVYLNLDGADVADGDVLMTGVSGDGAVVVKGIAGDPLYAPYVHIENRSLILGRRRETDYYKILGDNRGRFLNLVRSINPADNTLGRLDSVTNMDDLYSVMARSPILNPIRFMDPVRSVVRIVSDGGNTMRSGADVDGVRLYADEYDMYGMRGGFRFSMRDVAVGAEFLVGALERLDYEFGGAEIYGGSISLDYMPDDYFVRAAAGRYYAHFDAPYVFDGDGVASNPRGVDDFGTLDVGRSFVTGRVSLAPFVGARYDSVHILNCDDTDIRARIGARVTVNTGLADVPYQYNLRTVVDSAGDLMADLSVGAVSVADAVGTDVAVGVYMNDGRPTYKISTGVKVVF